MQTNGNTYLPLCGRTGRTAIHFCLTKEVDVEGDVQANKAMKLD